MASYSSWREGIQLVQGLEPPEHVLARLNAATDDVAAWIIEEEAWASAYAGVHPQLRFEGMTVEESQEVVAQRRVFETLRFELEAVRVRGNLGETLLGRELERYMRLVEDGPGRPAPELQQLRTQRHVVAVRDDRLRFAVRTALHERGDSDVVAHYARIAESQQALLGLCSVAERTELRGTAFSLTPTTQHMASDMTLDDRLGGEPEPAEAIPTDSRILSSPVPLAGRTIHGVDITGITPTALFQRRVGTWRPLLPYDNATGNVTVDIQMRGLGVANKTSSITQEWLHVLAAKYLAREKVLWKRHQGVFRHEWPGGGVAKMALGDDNKTRFGDLEPDESRFQAGNRFLGGDVRRPDARGWEVVPVEKPDFTDVSADPTVRYYPFTFYRRAAIGGSRCALWKYLHCMWELMQTAPETVQPADHLLGPTNLGYRIVHKHADEPRLHPDEVELLFAPFKRPRGEMVAVAPLIEEPEGGEDVPFDRDAVAIVPIDLVILRNEMETTYRLAQGHEFLLAPEAVESDTSELTLLALVGEGSGREGSPCGLSSTQASPTWAPRI